METNKGKEAVAGAGFGMRGAVGRLYRGYVIWRLRLDLFVVFMSPEVSFGVESWDEAVGKVDGWLVEGAASVKRPGSMREVLHERRLLDLISV